MLKIIFSIIALIIIGFLLVVSYANGVIRGLKLMSRKDVKRTNLEKVIIKKVFQTDANVDPFIYSLYVQHEIDTNNEYFKKKIISDREVEETAKLNKKKKATRKSSKKKSGTKKSK